MKPSLALAKIVWRHSPLGWVGLALVSLLLWLPVGQFVHDHVGPAKAPRVWPGEMALMWPAIGAVFIVMAAALAGAAIDRLRTRSGLQVVPGVQRHLHRLLWAAFGVWWLLAGVPSLLLTGPASLWWALPWSLGLAAAAMSLGLSGMVLGTPMRVIGFGVSLLAATHGLWRPRLADVIGEVSVDPATLRTAAATAGVLLCAVWVWTARHIARRITTAGEPTRDWRQLMRDMQMLQLTPTRLTLSGRDPRWLVMPSGQPTLRRDLGNLALNAAVLFALPRWFMPWAPALAVMPWFVFLTAWAAAPHVNGVWVSPRALLLPQGGRREGMALRLARQALARTLPRAALHSSVAAAALCLGARLDMAVGATWVLAALVSLPFAAAAALAPVPWVRSPGLNTFCGFIANTLFLGLLAATGHLGFGLPLGADGASWGWVALSLALSAALAVVLMALIARPWARLDWAHMPASPVRMSR